MGGAGSGDRIHVRDSVAVGGGTMDNRGTRGRIEGRMGTGAGTALFRDVVRVVQLPLPTIIRHRAADDFADSGDSCAVDRDLSHERHSATSTRLFRATYLIAIVMLALPGIVSPLYDPNAGWDWLWTDKLPDDHARYEFGNVALMSVVDGLKVYQDTHEDPLRVVAPGVKRLPFFFPMEDIQIDQMPMQLSALDGVTYFIYGVPELGGDFDTFVPGSNAVLDALSLAATNPDDDKSILRQAWWNDDGIFKYTVYELHLDKRWEKPAVTIQAEGDVVIGGFLRYLGYDILSHEFWLGRRLITNFFWEVLEAPTADYVVYIHLMDNAVTILVATWDSPITRTDNGNYYSSLDWEKGEYIIDRRTLTITDPNTPIADDYHIVIGLYDRATQTRVPVTIDGQPAGDGFRLAETFARDSRERVNELFDRKWAAAMCPQNCFSPPGTFRAMSPSYS